MQILSTSVELGSVSGATGPAEPTGPDGVESLDFSDVFAEQQAQSVIVEEPEVDVDVGMDEQRPEHTSEDAEPENESVEDLSSGKSAQMNATQNAPVFGQLDAAPPGLGREVEGRMAQTPDRVPEVRTSNRAPEVQTPDRAPEAQTPDRAPEVRTPDRAPDVRTPDRAPAVRTPDRAPEAQTPDRVPEVRTSDRAPEAQIPDRAPEVRTPDRAPEVRTPDRAPEVRAPDRAPEGTVAAKYDPEKSIVRAVEESGLRAKVERVEPPTAGWTRGTSRDGARGPSSQGAIFGVDEKEDVNRSDPGRPGAGLIDKDAAVKVSQAVLPGRTLPTPGPGAARQSPGSALSPPVAEAVARAPQAPPLIETRPTNDLSRVSVGQDHFEFAFTSPDTDAPIRRRPAPSHPNTGAVMGVKHAEFAIPGIVQDGTVVSPLEADVQATGSVLSSGTTSEVGLRIDPLIQTNSATVQQARPEAVRLAAAQAIEVFAHNPDRKVEIAMSPEELGRVRMSLSTSESTVMVHIAVERPETQDLMRRHLDQLINEFRRLGYEDIAFDFGDARDQGGGESGSPEGHPRSAAPAVQDAVDPVARPQNLNANGLDIRL